MRLGYAGPLLRLGAPAAYPRARGEPLAAVAEALASPGLRRVRLPPAYERPPILLVAAGVYDELAKLDYNHLYARIASVVLDEFGYAEEAAWFRRWVALRESLPRSVAERYVLVDAKSSFAEMETLGARRCSSSQRCRGLLAGSAGEPPLTRDEALEVLRRLRDYVVSAVPLKAFVKYIPHVVVGLSRRWRTGLWENVVTRSRDAARELMRGCEVAAYVVDAAIVVGRCRPRTRYPYKEEARGPGLVATPGTYRVDDEYGYWGVWDEPPVEPVVEDGVLLGVRYAGAERCLHGGACSRIDIVRRAAEKLGVHIGATLAEITDTQRGVVREWVDDSLSRVHVVVSRRLTRL